MKINESVLVGVDFSETDKGVLIVGRQTKGRVEIINAFEGKEAYDLYTKLVTKKEI